jgi:hypothetical protein
MHSLWLWLLALSVALSVVVCPVVVGLLVGDSLAWAPLSVGLIVCWVWVAGCLSDRLVERELR